MTINNSEFLKSKGIYKITNTINGKCYIGSTMLHYGKRIYQHFYELSLQKHKNKYLQASYNKYGEESFIAEFLEEIDDKLFIGNVETSWISFYKSYDKSKGYNINRYGTGGVQFDEKTYKKRGESFKKTFNEALVFYYKVKKGELIIEDVPEKYKKTVISKLNHIIWNKGLKGDVVDYSYLKGIKKTKTEKYIQGRIPFKEKMRSKTPLVYVFKETGEFIGKFRSNTDIAEISLKNPELFSLKLRNQKGRNGLPPHILKHQNIGNCCRGISKSYKGLKFFYETLELLEKYKEIDVFNMNQTSLL